MIATIAGVVLAVYAIRTSMTKEDADELRSRMETYRIANALQLEHHFPLGYVVFGLDSELNVIPPRNQMIDCEVDWGTFEIFEFSREKIVLQLPSLSGHCGTNPGAKYRENVAIIPRDDEGDTVCLFYNKENALYLHVAQDNYHGRILVFGIGAYPGGLWCAY